MFLKNILFLTIIAFPLTTHAESLPFEIEKEISDAKEICRGDFIFEPAYIKSSDLNMDGQKDYILTSKSFDCSVSSALYSGSAGFSHTLYITDKNGVLRKQNNTISAYDFYIDENFEPPHIIYKGRCFMDGMSVGESRWQWKEGEMIFVSTDHICPEN
jgi:hypothetical protein